MSARFNNEKLLALWDLPWNWRRTGKVVPVPVLADLEAEIRDAAGQALRYMDEIKRLRLALACIAAWDERPTAEVAREALEGKR